MVHHATSCSCCSKDFSTADVVEVAPKAPVFDIPAPRMEVTEHQLGVAVCCGRQHWGCFPPEVGQPVQYGSRIKALSVLLNNDYKLPLEKIEQLMGDLWGCSFNESTALTANAGMYQALEPIEEQIKTAVLASDVVHFDETGMRVEKNSTGSTSPRPRCSPTCSSTKNGARRRSNPKPRCSRTSPSGRARLLGSYFDFQQCKHALCGTHLLRN
ncbi:MAG: transposase [Saprospiraceae bacterium]|nr:transposase [Saprospiraceae bacterium]